MADSVDQVNWAAAGTGRKIRVAHSFGEVPPFPPGESRQGAQKRKTP
jgi:hypothetical protein